MEELIREIHGLKPRRVLGVLDYSNGVVILSFKSRKPVAEFGRLVSQASKRGLLCHHEHVESKNGIKNHELTVSKISAKQLENTSALFNELGIKFGTNKDPRRKRPLMGWLSGLLTWRRKP